MNWVLNSRVYKNSKFKEKILASANDPINKALVEQVNSYVDSKYVFKLQKELEEAKAKLAEQDEGEEFIGDENEGSDSPVGSKSSGSRSITHTSSTPLSFTPSEDFESSSSSDGDEEFDFDDIEIQDGDSESSEDEGEIEESTSVDGEVIISSTVTTLDDVSQYVGDIVGILNLRDDTVGCLYASIKGTDELWVYYDKKVDASQIVENVNKELQRIQCFFLEFNRVSRDDNAIVFTIKLVSNPPQFKSLQEVLDA